MSNCVLCNQEISVKSTTHKCFKCRRRVTLKQYGENNKETLTEYQARYRKENREVCNQRCKIAENKKPEYYRKKKRDNYRRKHGIPLDDPFVKRKDGEGSIGAAGYKTITRKGHPNSMDERGRILEHILVMSDHIGRPLKKGESVHNRNGIRNDNRIENLELWHKGQPAGQRLSEKLAWAIEFIQGYGYKVVKE